MSSKKTVLKETPNLPASSQQKVKQKNDYLRECINTILKRELLHLNIRKVFDILVNDLHINLRNVTPRMKYVLSECLCYYIKMWPGWQKYDVVCTNERSKVEYIEKFKEYLSFKIKFILENERLFNPDVANKKRPIMVSQEIQTEPISKRNKPEAPYNLVISGQPNVLNNIVFIEMHGDIVIKQHAEKPWKPLTVAEFLNYSFVYVSIRLPDLELTRSNLHEFQRYITECGDCASCPDVDFITYIRKRNIACKPQVYSLDYIHAYCKQFLDIIKKIQGINAVKITELEEVFRQFILDIKESNVFSSTNLAGKTVNTMATDTAVCYNIGGKTYIRNKKMVVNTDNNQKEANAINFCEVLIPRMAYTLSKFTADEDITTEDTTFKSLNEISEEITKGSEKLYKFIDAVNNSVAYHCLLCPKAYTGERAYIDILDHYRFLHKGEQSVLCFSCRKQFTIAKLAGSRWSHECGEGVSKDAPVTASSTTTGKTDTIQSYIGGFIESLVTNQNTPTTKTPIGINDILSSGKSTISFDDLITKPNAVDVTSVNTVDNSTPTITNTNTVMNNLPVVRVSAGNAIMPSSVLLTIAPKLTNTMSNVILSNPMTVISRPISIAPRPSIACNSTVNITSSDVSIPSNTVLTDAISAELDVADDKDEIQSQINMQLASACDDINRIAVINPPINITGDVDAVTPTISVANVTAGPASIVLNSVATTPINTVSLHIPPLVLATKNAETSVSTDFINADTFDTIAAIPTSSVSTMAISDFTNNTSL